VTGEGFTTCLWFDGQADQAANFYVSIFPNSKLGRTSRYSEAGPGEPGSVLAVEFELNGQKFVGVNGGPEFTFDEAISLLINCADQAEIDYYWDKLTEGGEEGPCGWLKDKFGLSWQVCPVGWQDLLNDPDKGRAERAMTAMFGMKKLDIAALQAAADGA
jgi:predicted 3-demethylubiquinone-9 3-methyltransferase (glyoxalase superfamily)